MAGLIQEGDEMMGEDFETGVKACRSHFCGAKRRQLRNCRLWLREKWACWRERKRRILFSKPDEERKPTEKLTDLRGDQYPRHG